jgi:glycogen phosphorylase
MRPDAASPGETGSLTYRASVSSSRPSSHFTPRIVPYHPEARIPIETPLITWPG